MTASVPVKPCDGGTVCQRDGVSAVPKAATAWGLRGMPREFVHQMYADYLRLGSLEKVGEIHNRTRQSVYDLLHRRGFALNKKKTATGDDVIIHEGLKYTRDARDGYFRCTQHDTIEGDPYLHRRLWIRANGPIPPKHEVVVINGNKSDVRLENLQLQWIGTNARKLGHNQFTHDRQASLCEQHIGWITKQAHRYVRPGVDLDDLIQEGRLAIIHADEKFDNTRGVKFLSYASIWIRQRMQRFVANHGGTVRIPVHNLGKVFVPVASLDEEIGEEGFTLGDTIGTEETVTEEAAHNDYWTGLQPHLNALDERSRAILHARFFDNRTLDDIGGDFGLTRERIRQLQNMALRRLRKRMEGKKAA